MKVFLNKIFGLAVLFFLICLPSEAGVISDAPKISILLLNVLKFLLNISGILAMIVLVASGIMYTISSGDEKSIQRAKNTAKYAALGLLVSLLSLAITTNIVSMLEG